MKRRAKRRIIAPPLPRVGPIPALPSEHRKVRISFERIRAGGAYCLSECQRDQVKEAIDAMRQLTSLAWTGISAHGGLRLKWLPESGLVGVTRPEWLSEEVRIAEVRASDRFRILGYRDNDDFVILWFDPDHEATGA
jgi:hypothetical protein